MKIAELLRLSKGKMKRLKVVNEAIALRRAKKMLISGFSP
jgi:hypothetical protein